MFKIIRLLFSLAVIVAVVLIIKKVMAGKMAYDNCRRFSFCYRLGTYVGLPPEKFFAKILVTTRGI